MTTNRDSAWIVPTRQGLRVRRERDGVPFHGGPLAGQFWPGDIDGAPREVYAYRTSGGRLAIAERLDGVPKGVLFYEYRLVGGTWGRKPRRGQPLGYHQARFETKGGS